MSKTANEVATPLMAQLRAVEAGLRGMADLFDTPDPIVKHRSSTGRDFSALAEQLLQVRHRVGIVAACYEDWSKRADPQQREAGQ